MRLNTKFRIGRYQVSIMAGPVTNVTGINSTLKDGQHIVMWEFDETEETFIKAALQAQMDIYGLPDIHIARSHPGGGFHAYSFRRCSFVESLHIVSGTPHVDPNYITLCAMRQHWTLRLTDKGQGQPEHLITLKSKWKPDCDFMDLAGVVFYRARRKGRAE